MKQSENLIPKPFDGKDFIVDEDLWSYFYDNYYKYIPHCESYHDFTSLFFIGDCNKAYKAQIIAPWQNIIEVTALQDNGTMYYPDVKSIIEIFTSDNDDDENDIYVTHELVEKNQHGEIIGIKFKYYNTEE